MLTSPVIATLIFLFTLVLVIWQPKRLNIGWSATIGAALALRAWLVRSRDVIPVPGIVCSATLTWVPIIIISLILNEVAFSVWPALHMARFPDGTGINLLVYRRQRHAFESR